MAAATPGPFKPAAPIMVVELSDGVGESCESSLQQSGRLFSAERSVAGKHPRLQLNMDWIELNKIDRSRYF